MSGTTLIDSLPSNPSMSSGTPVQKCSNGNKRKKCIL